MKNKKEHKELERNGTKAAKKELKENLTQHFFGVIKGLGYNTENDKSEIISVTKLFAKRLTKVLIKLTPNKSVENDTIKKTATSKVQTPKVAATKPQTSQAIKQTSNTKSTTSTKTVKAIPKTKRNTTKKA